MKYHIGLSDLTITGSSARGNSQEGCRGKSRREGHEEVDPSQVEAPHVGRSNTEHLQQTSLNTEAFQFTQLTVSNKNGA